MGFNEVRSKKSRADQAVDRIVEELTIQNGSKFVFPPDAPFQFFYQLIQDDFKDAEEICQKQNRPVSDVLPEGEAERSAYAKDLARCARQHFEEHSLQKFQTALAELIHESLLFSYPNCRQQQGLSEEEVNESRPSLADIQQNVLRRSILRLKGLPYQKSEGIEGAENNSELLATARASAEIYNHLAFWTYNHLHVFEILQPFIFSMMQRIGGYDNPSHSSRLAAREAAEVIWDNIDGAMQAMTNILIEYSLCLAAASIKQRHSIRFESSEIRANLPSATYLKKIAGRWLDSWYDVLTVKISKRGRTFTNEATRARQRAEAKSCVIKAMFRILDEQEKISQWRVAKILNIGNKKKNRDRTLYNRLISLDLKWKELVAEAKQTYPQKRTNK